MAIPPGRSIKPGRGHGRRALSTPLSFYRLRAEVAVEMVPARTSHHRILDALGPLDVVSAYHAASGEKQGEESMPTHFRHDGDCHIDHVFVPAAWQLDSAVVLGRKGSADHAPMIVKALA
jgi:hypothetical protein